MPKDKTEQLSNFEAREKIILQLMGIEEPSLTPHHRKKPSAKENYIMAYKIIPLAWGLFSEILESAGEISTGEGLGEFIKFSDEVPVEEITMAHHTLTFLGLIGNIVNLARLLSVYFSSRQIGIDLPWNFTKKAKTLYYATAVVLSTLVVIFTFLNPPVAAILIIAGTSLALLSSVATVFKTIKHRYFSPEHSYAKDRQALETLMQEIPALEKSLAIAKSKITAFRNTLKDMQLSNQRFTAMTPEEKQEASRLLEEYNDIFKKLIPKYIQRETLLEKKEVKNERLAHKIFAVPLTIASVVGLSIAIANPVLGLAIAGVAALVGISLIGLIPLGQWVHKKISAWKAKKVVAVEKVEKVEEPEKEPKIKIHHVENMMKVCPITGIYQEKAESPERRLSNASTITAPIEANRASFELHDEDEDGDVDTEDEGDSDSDSEAEHVKVNP